MSSGTEGAHSPLFVLQGHTSAVLSCAFYPATHYDATRSNLMLSGDVDGVVLLWDLLLRQPLLRLEPLALAESQGNTSAQVGPPAFRHSGAASVLQVGFLCFERDQTGVVGDDAEASVACNALAVRDDARPPPRARFRLRRQHKSTTEATSSGNASLFFFTQCRNQRVYLWAYSGNSLAVGDERAATTAAEHCRLQHSLFVPQQGFCAVTVAACGDGVVRMAIPHDTQATISVWSITRRDKEEAAVQGSNSDAAATAMPASSLPMASSLLHVQSYCTFAAAPASVNTGGIMHVAMHDAQHISIACESGHLSLCQDMTRGEEEENGNTKEYMTRCTSKDDRRSSQERFHIIALLRAFPETALVCLWQDDRVLATSAEGRIQCYHVFLTQSAKAVTASLQLVWECTLGKGVGTAALQHHLALIGAWDSTLRVYDARSGRVITVLPFHAATVNAVTLMPAAVAPLAAFGYDVRRPCCYSAPEACKTTSASCSANGTSLPLLSGGAVEPGVYLCASASKDYTVAIWRIDFYELCRPSLGDVAPSRLLTSA